MYLIIQEKKYFFELLFDIMDTQHVLLTALI